MYGGINVTNGVNGVVINGTTFPPGKYLIGGNYYHVRENGGVVCTGQRPYDAHLYLEPGARPAPESSKPEAPAKRFTPFDYLVTLLLGMIVLAASAAAFILE